MSARGSKSVAELITGMAVAFGLGLLGTLFLLMAYAAGLEDGYAEAAPGEGLFGFRQDVVVFGVLGSIALVGGIVMWLRMRRGRRGRT